MFSTRPPNSRGANEPNQPHCFERSQVSFGRCGRAAETIHQVPDLEFGAPLQFGDRVLRAVILDVFDQQLQDAGLFPGGERIPHRLEFSQRLADLILVQQCLPERLFPLSDFGQPLFAGADLIIEVGDEVDVRVWQIGDVLQGERLDFVVLRDGIAFKGNP